MTDIYVVLYDPRDSGSEESEVTVETDQNRAYLVSQRYARNMTGIHVLVAKVEKMVIGEQVSEIVLREEEPK